MIEDNTNALYCDPNAYIQNFSKKEKQERKKVIFQEPYECIPPYYINNNFKKHNCDCVPGHKKESDCNHKQNEDANKGQSFPFSFDIKNLLPMLSNLGGANGSGLNNLISMLGNSGSGSGNGLDFSKLISTFLSNGNGLSMLGGLLKKQEKKSHEIKSTDIPIKNYTRVE